LLRAKSAKGQHVGVDAKCTTLGGRPELQSVGRRPPFGLGDTETQERAVPAEQLNATTTNTMGEVVILCGEEEIRDVLAYWFQSLPVPTFVADDGYHANRILNERNCRLLITDRVLPPWPGLDTIRALRDHNPQMRVAFVENGNIHDRILAGIVGATDYFPRPLSRQTVVNALTRADAAS
jgi:CheY-like chemotaxis protein